MGRQFDENVGMKRLLLADEVTRSAVEAELLGSGWRHVPSTNKMTEVIRYKSSWIDAHGTDVANYLENTPLACSYVLVTENASARLHTAFSRRGWVLEAQQVLDHSWSDDADALRTIGRLGLLSHGDFDAKIFAKLSALLLHPNQAWRRFALYALSNTSWDAYGLVVRKAISEGLYAEGLAGEAEALVRDLEAGNWNDDLYKE